MARSALIFAVQFPIVLSGCSCQEKHSASLQTHSVVSATRPFSAGDATGLIGSPRVLWNIPPVKLDSLPDFSTIQDLSMVGGLNVSAGGTMNERSFKQLMASAKLANDKQLADHQWAYAQWYAGTFVTTQGVYAFELYLGGRGKLLCPDGKLGLFVFPPPLSTGLR